MQADGGGVAGDAAQFEVTSWKDDGYEKSGGYPDLDGAVAFNDGGTVALRFAGVRLPRGARIASARLTLATYGDGGTKPLSLVYSADAAGNSDPLSYAYHDFSGRVRTAQTVTQAAVPAWGNGEWQSPELAAIVQEVVDGAGWVSGNALTLILESDGGSRYIGTADNGMAAVLTVNYTAP